MALLHKSLKTEWDKQRIIVKIWPVEGSIKQGDPLMQQKITHRIQNWKDRNRSLISRT